MTRAPACAAARFSGSHSRFQRVAASLLMCLFMAACGSDSASTMAVRPTTPGASETNTTSAPIRGEELPGRLLFVQSGTIWLWQGRGAQPLINGGAFQPSWSPDGSRIAYVERGQSYSDIRVADSNGTHLLQLTNNSSKTHDSFQRVRESTWALYPTWSPDDTSVVFAGQFAPPTGDPAAEFNLSLYRISATGASQRTQLLADEEAQCGRSIYAPDSSLVYVRAPSNGDGSEQLYRYRADTSSGTPLPGAPTGSYDPAFSPDGAWLAFAARDGSSTDIWVLPAASGVTSTPIRISTSGTARAPAFSPDGKRLAFLAIPPAGKGFDLWVSDLIIDSSGQPHAGIPRQITNDMHLDGDSGLSWAR